MLVAFPLLLLGMVYVFLFFSTPQGGGVPVGSTFAGVAPLVIAATLIWFAVAWFFHTSIIQQATGSRPLERRENKRVYNLVENLCISTGMAIPRIFIIEDDSLNAFASGISDRTYAISLSRGIINQLEDDELEGVIAHELGHIKNRDILIGSIAAVMAGAISYLANFALFFGGSRDEEGGGNMITTILMMILAPMAAMLIQMAISRGREYLADATGAEICGRPQALASALDKLANYNAQRPMDVNPASAQMYIVNPLKGGSISGLFSTHPPMEERIRRLLAM